MNQDLIALRLRDNLKFKGLVQYYNTSDGQRLYETFLHKHTQIFPEYIDELQGVADGSNFSFHKIFLMNIIEEYAASKDVLDGKKTKPASDHCSDYVLVTEEEQIVVHNEDSSASDKERTLLVVARIGNDPKFVAYTYAGDLPSGAFGFNENGIAFTLNYVQPADIDIKGLGRGFLSRDLLGADNLIDAQARITHTDQCAGHNYQLMDVQANRVFNVEAASFDRFSILEFLSNDHAFFHANQYQFLHISQPPYESSLRRLHRVHELPYPKTLNEILKILGDQKDVLYPIFHDELSHTRGDLSGFTLNTAVFQLDKSILTILKGNPHEFHVVMQWNLTSCNELAA